MSTSVFLIALAAPFLWAIVNHVDKFILTHYGEKDGSVGSIMLFTNFFSAIVLVVLFFIDPHVLATSVHDRYWLIASGLAYAGFLYFYLEALSRDEASIVLPIFQFVPIFAFIMSSVLLGESLNTHQLIGSAIVIVFGIVMVWDIDGDSLAAFKWKTLFLGLISSIFYAGSETIFKVGSIENIDFTQSLFWNNIGLVIVGCALFLSSKKIRTGFLNIFRVNAKKVLALNTVGEVGTLFGDIATRYALLLAPVTVVLVVGGVQPLFVFIIGSVLTILAPQYFSEKTSKKHIIHKAIAIIGITIGSIILLS